MAFPRDLRCFCEHVADKYGSPGAASEDQKADEFREAYFSGTPLHSLTLMELIMDFGIGLQATNTLPKGVRGFYHYYRDSGAIIYYKRDDCESGLQNTLLHEIREIMEAVFAEVCPGAIPLKTRAVHIAANKFASAVLLPQYPFTKQVDNSGFDTITLADYYSKSCAQVLLRIGEVLRWDIFFYAALYENVKDDHDDDLKWRLTYWTHGESVMFPDGNPKVPARFFPRKGHQPDPNSMVQLAINSARTILAKRISVNNGTNNNGLTAIVQPLVRSGKVIKVALVVVSERHRNLLKPQIEKTKPLVIDHWHEQL